MFYPFSGFSVLVLFVSSRKRKNFDLHILREEPTLWVGQTSPKKIPFPLMVARNWHTWGFERFEDQAATCCCCCPSIGDKSWRAGGGCADTDGDVDVIVQGWFEKKVRTCIGAESWGVSGGNTDVDGEKVWTFWAPVLETNLKELVVETNSGDS